MAFQDVNPRTTKEAVKLTGLKVGESVTGFVAGFTPSKQNPDNMNIIMQGEDGSRFFVYTAGNVKYLITDGKVKAGLLTLITRTEDRKMKNGKITSSYSVQQDPDQIIAVSAQAPIVARTEDDEFNALGNTPVASKPLTSIKEQAARISASMKKNG